MELFLPVWKRSRSKIFPFNDFLKIMETTTTHVVRRKAETHRAVTVPVRRCVPGPINHSAETITTEKCVDLKGVSVHVCLTSFRALVMRDFHSRPDKGLGRATITR